MIEVIIIFSVVLLSMFLIAAYYGFKAIIDEFYDLSDNETPSQDAIQTDSQ